MVKSKLPVIWQPTAEYAVLASVRKMHEMGPTVTPTTRGMRLGSMCCRCWSRMTMPAP
ncbi:hypothetical protein PF011_g25461 [Phytophthora fragariae]|uniref:Uncharacterized protein n=1 Tax=Phytophthora fragariae TaxID=53985 RepID=A0A6A3HXG3_9STRA|nr:hypothetical protein PF011_g25461 [Phytophthora fragariae]